METQQSESKYGWDISRITDKDWGRQISVFGFCNVQIDQIFAEKGKECSRHKHFHKYNMFIVVKGKLKVEIWNRKTQEISTFIIGPDEQHSKVTAYPGVFHKFTALEDTDAIEVYWTRTTKEDIFRDYNHGRNVHSDSGEHGEQKDT